MPPGVNWPLRPDRAAKSAQVDGSLERRQPPRPRVLSAEMLPASNFVCEFGECVRPTSPLLGACGNACLLVSGGGGGERRVGERRRRASAAPLEPAFIETWVPPPSTTDPTHVAPPLRSLRIRASSSPAAGCACRLRGAQLLFQGGADARLWPHRRVLSQQRLRLLLRPQDLPVGQRAAGLRR